MFLGLSVLIGSEQEGVGSYIMNKKINTLIIKKLRKKFKSIEKNKT